MTTHDTPEAAIAAALHRMGQDSDRARDWCNSWATGALHQQIHDDDAAAILAAMPGWTLVPTAELGEDRMTMDLMETAIRKDQAEIARLRAALRRIAHSQESDLSIYAKFAEEVARAALAPQEASDD